MAGSSSDLSSTIPSSYFKYDVFLSFRGYTRLRFTDTLYHALINKRIETFRDSKELRIGEEIKSALLEAIERSRMSILILCDEYPTSPWCLDELVKIMECSDNGRKRAVLPIFYYVEPSDVRHQINEYGKAMTHHVNKGRYNHKLEAWKSALFAVGNNSGVCVNQQIQWGVAINKIVEEVTRRLPPLPLYIDHPLGCDSELEKVKTLLEIDSPSATSLMLGIHGDGEISQFVAELYNNIRPHFANASFLSKIRGKTNESSGGLEDLQETLLSEMGEELKTKIGSTFKGAAEIKQRLGQKRSLAAREDWFGGGSRIIITTGNEGVLDEHVLNNGSEIRKYCYRGKQVAEEDDVDEGDVGKTTLAKKIFHHKEVKSLFPFRGWARVSEDCKLREVWLGLLDSLKLPSYRYKNSTEEFLKETVRGYLKGEKYLIVLDDIWKPEVWGNLKAAFPNESNGSKVLITSRNEEVANFTSSGLYKLPLLDEKESWELFCKMVFSSMECPPSLEPHGRSIVESCGGLPLAIVAIAGVVAKKKRLESEWLGVKESIHWHLTRDMTKVLDTLKLSYDNLSEELKPCFRYLGIYPEDYEIPAREIIQLWMAEGFLLWPEESGLPNTPVPENVGKQYLQELVDRNMVQMTRKRKDRGAKKFLIHDLFRNLCIKLSKADKFFELKKLRHVYLGAGSVTLPTNENGTIMWNLQTIHSLELDTTTASLFKEGRFPNLRKLGLWMDPKTGKHCSWHELLLSLQHLSNLHKLKLRCCHSDLKIDARMFPSNLAKISLDTFGEMNSSSMKALGQLPNLQVLKLFNGEISDPLDCATGEFPKLQYFKIYFVKVESWTLEKGAMSHLQYLVIDMCSELRQLPEQIWSLTTLSKVHVINASCELADNLQHVKVNNNCDLTISVLEEIPDSDSSD
ncbi:hypothetical protein PIB30_032245 [Stylosanthes scabra]|uniref:TIR domain-containing protein n=1 Tax=Stylosanthes scabra TaxID=79078 RepID=A0ABU6VAE2_9FABA|nr:hypothetical protein [Stylosanthes scabra]